ncbi:class I adenylate-forming enzyme family protein [Sphingobium tyrosinilyticum]|uniref:Class I adenylate-forming enzyme family protein n=1 Tax=Sphingobium tyrosinilyticum TaxID=2715436 RepID=A0ABV9EYU2_9SPHN
MLNDFKQPIRHEMHFGRMVRCHTNRAPTVHALLRSAAEHAPERVAVVAGDLRLTYEELGDKVERIASAWVARDISKGDRLAILIGNRPEFLFTILAAARIGVIVVPLNPRQKLPEIQFMLQKCEAKAIVFEASMAEEVPKAETLPLLSRRFVVSGETEGAEPFDWLAEAPFSASFAEVAEPHEDDPFCILYTSGTTGEPKGATLSQLGVVHSVAHYRHGFGLRDGDVAALAVPASHVTGLVAILLAAIGVAGTTVMMTDFKARDLLALIDRERVTYTLMVPAMYNLCLLALDSVEADLSSWRVGGFGGAPMPDISITRLAEKIPGLGLFNIYGATETTSPATILRADQLAARADSVGQPVDCADILIVDEDGHEVPRGQCGEVLIGGPMTISAYWNNAEANASAFIGGYWRSGDIGSMDEEGYLRISDRLKDVINRGGYKIYSLEVEHVIARLPGVVECAVVGYPDSVLGERVAAFVCGSLANAEAAVKAHCARNLSDYKLPELVVQLDGPLPRNANGKVMKAQLRALVGPGR